MPSPGPGTPSIAYHPIPDTLDSPVGAEQSAMPAHRDALLSKKQGAGGERRGAPYLHQLPPVLPKNSFFSEFHMNFFQLPSSLAFPRAMVAAQQWWPRPREGECGARPGVLAAAARCPPRPGSKGKTRRCRCGSASARRAAEQPRQSGRRGRCGGGGGRRDEGGGRARAGRLRASHLAVGARPLSRLLPALSERFSGGSANPAAAAPSCSYTTLPAVTSAETGQRLRGKVTGKDDRSGARARHTRAQATSREIG